MADHKKWFKVWTSILSDPDFELMPLEDWGRWLKLCSLAALHGVTGNVTMPVTYFKQKFNISDGENLKLPNVTTVTSNGLVTVTIKNWEKYQVFSESYDRVVRYREKQKTKKEENIVTETLQPLPDKKRREEKNITTVHLARTFQKPTIQEITSYCNDRKNSVDPEKFFSHYESNGWKVGRNPMKSWRAAVITWEKSGLNGEPVKKPRWKSNFT